jgi:signal transduction histidine kinase
MSHELRSPLNAIIGFSALLHAGKVGALSETQTEYLGDILTSARHLLQLINDVIDLAKLEAGRVDLQPQKVELARVVTDVKHMLRDLVLEKKLDIVVQIGDGLDDVVIDPGLLKRVLYNCLANAITSTPPSGQVHVGIEATSPDSFVLSVRGADSVFSAELPRRPRSPREGE